MIIVQDGALKFLVYEMQNYKLELLAIQETRQLGQGIYDYKWYTIFYNGKSDGSHELGTTFIVSKKLRNNVTDFQPINERICSLCMKTKSHNMWIINAYGPTEEKAEEIKDDFYETPENTYNVPPRYDIKLTANELNAKIGKEEIYKGITSKHSLHAISNNNGERLIDFAGSKNMVISSTYFIHPNIHKQTWQSPDRLNTNQIDHVLIDKWFASSILDVISQRGAHCNSDHYLIKIKYRARINLQKQVECKKQPKIDTQKLKNAEILHKYWKKYIKN
jgi:hypothetical protein